MTRHTVAGRKVKLSLSWLCLQDGTRSSIIMRVRDFSYSEFVIFFDSVKMNCGFSPGDHECFYPTRFMTAHIPIARYSCQIFMPDIHARYSCQIFMSDKVQSRRRNDDVLEGEIRQIFRDVSIAV